MALYLCGQKGFRGYRLGAGWLGRAGGTKVREREREKERDRDREGHTVIRERVAQDNG